MAVLLHLGAIRYGETGVFGPPRKMSERTVEARLREEYFVFLLEAQRVLEELEAEVRHCLLPVSNRLDKYERLVVTSRIKDCESALAALRRRQEGATFDPDRA